MGRKKSLGSFGCAWATVLALIFTVGCADGHRRPGTEPAIWFVHATDPHLFLDVSTPEDKRKVQEKLDEQAVSDMWQRLPSLENGGRTFSFLVLTGDFGVEPCSIADLPAAANPAATIPKEKLPPAAKDCLDKVNATKRADQVGRLADLLGKSPVPDIYLVAGNNDIASETADDAGLIYFNQFMDEVQKKIDDARKTVRLHNLTRCYLSDGSASTCYADIAGTSYRLIGFPSYSFKNKDTDRKSNTGDQEKQFDKFESLLEQARQLGKRVLIVSHVPLIDDPYTMAQERYAIPLTSDRDPDSPQSHWSTWNVSKKLSEEWEEVIASDSVAGVLAGHLHDSHKEIYRPPYTWSTVNDPRTGFSKLFMAPPLAVKNQDTSPIQARGLSIVGLEPDQIEYSIYWYSSETHDFVPDRGTRFQREERRGRWGWWQTTKRTVAWLWELADSAESLDRMTVLLIAFVAAFLTVVQVWQIPSPDNPQAGQKSDSGTDSANSGKDNDTGKTKTSASKSAYEPSPFASNFGKTVITGLGGLAAESVLKSLENKPSANDKEFYVVWFVIFFFLILVLGALVRALGEAVRERIAIVHLKYQRTPLPFPAERASGWVRFKYRISSSLNWTSYWALRIAYWLLSLRSTLLIFLDTFLNLIQGKNQTLTRVFSKTIIDQQRNMVCVAQSVRTYLNDEIRQRVLAHTRHPDTDERVRILDSRNVRVNISVMSADQSKVFYIARAPGSANTGFIKRSVAWVSVFTGKIRWYKKDYSDAKIIKDIVLFDNKKGVIPGDEETIYLNSHYQLRDDDYEAFIMFPLPWPRRGSGSEAVKGAIHISFSKQEDFEKLWEFPALTEKDKNTLKEKMTQEDWQKSVDRSRAERDKAREAHERAKEAHEKAKAEHEKAQLEHDKARSEHDRTKADADKEKADRDKDRADRAKEKADTEKAKADAFANDPVLLGNTYEFEDRMLGEWCDDAETRVSLLQAVKVLGELLHGFNENIYLSSKKDDQCSGG